MTEKGLPEGTFPGTNTEPVLDGIHVVSQDPNYFADQDGEVF